MNDLVSESVNNFRRAYLRTNPTAEELADINRTIGEKYARTPDDEFVRWMDRLTALIVNPPASLAGVGLLPRGYL